MDTIIRLDHINKLYTQHQPILKDISLSIFKNQSIAFLGCNGSGKTTLLKIIAGLIRPSTGKVIYNPSSPLRVGFAPEHFPKPKFTAEEYLYTMGRIQKLPKPYLNERIGALLDRFNLRESHSIAYFSKGMTQKVNLLQAVLGNPDVLILDEPLSGLDVASQKDLAEMLSVFKQQGITIIMSCHETDLLSQIADRVIVINGGVVESDNPYIREIEPVIRIVFSNPKLEESNEVTDWMPVEYIQTLKNGNELIVKEENSDLVLYSLLERKYSILSVERDYKPTDVRKVIHHQEERG